MKIHSNTSFRNFSTTFDLRFCAIDSVQSELIGVVKVDGGIKYLIRQFKVINSDHVLREILERGFFSARPYQLGQTWDGSITACVLALFFGSVRSAANCLINYCEQPSQLNTSNAIGRTWLQPPNGKESLILHGGIRMPARDWLNRFTKSIITRWPGSSLTLPMEAFYEIANQSRLE